MPIVERIPIIIGAVIAFLLQLIVAPNIALLGAIPNFALAYVIVIAIANARNAGYIMPFILGLACDLVGNGPVGAMALLFVLATMIVSFLFIAVGSEGIPTMVIFITVSCLIVNIIYALLMIACGLPIGLLEALLSRALPLWLYDTVLALIMLPLVLRFVIRRKETNEMPIINS